MRVLRRNIRVGLRKSQLVTLTNNQQKMAKKAANLACLWFTISCFLILAPKLFGQYTLEYSVNGNVITLIGYLGTPVNVTIPNGVTSIGAGAFADCSSLSSVSIPNTVFNIGDNAFYWCINLTGVTIPDSVTIVGDEAFNGCFSLTEVTIGSGVTSIGGEVFADCTTLTNINVSSSNPTYSSIDGVLFDEHQTILMRYPSGLSGSYTVPDSVTSVGDEAFFQCMALTTVTIPSSVTTCGGDAFAGCTSLTTVTIPNSVTSIGFEAFYECTSLTDVTIGNGVTDIDDFAFEDCTNLTAVYFIGNAPTAYAPFSGDSATIYYFPGTTGWTSPFAGLPAVEIIPASPTLVATINNQQLTLHFTGSLNFPYILESATDLSPPINWRPVTTNAADPNGNWTFTLKNILAVPQCFYRVSGQ
jgi:hypothetical protein